jgi:NAD(P)H-flavin reductase
VVLRVSKNGEKLQSGSRNVEFTRDYFNKRVLAEASIEGFSRVWICGPPKLNTDTAKILLENGYTN